MSDMVECVARAIWERRRALAKSFFPDVTFDLEEWGDGSIPRSNGVLEEAEAAIAAFRVVEFGSICARIDAIEKTLERNRCRLELPPLPK